MWTRMSTSIQTSQWIDHVITVSSAPHERPSPAFDLGMGQKHPRPCSSHQRAQQKMMDLWKFIQKMALWIFKIMDLWIYSSNFIHLKMAWFHHSESPNRDGHRSPTIWWSEFSKFRSRHPQGADRRGWEGGGPLWDTLWETTIVVAKNVWFVWFVDD